MYQLLKTLCNIQAPSGNEEAMTVFLLDHIKQNQSNWKVQPEIFYGPDFQNCIVLVFGKPRTAVFAHIDNIGFTVRYGKELIKIGGPRVSTGYKLTGVDSHGEIACTLNTEEEGILKYDFHREIDRGTALSFKAEFKEDESAVQCAYMDNRLGVFTALKLSESLDNGIVVFSCWEEHHGGSVPYLAKFMYERYMVRQTLICDITWVTAGVPHGNGVVVSLRDSGIPRRSYVNKIIALLKKAGVPYQLEVESSGGSDGNELQRQPYPIDWCFIGAPEDHVHTPDERVFKKDIDAMIWAYSVLMKEL